MRSRILIADVGKEVAVSVLVIPIQEEDFIKEWQWCSRVVLIGELVFAQEGKYSTRDMDRY